MENNKFQAVSHRIRQTTISEVPVIPLDVLPTWGQSLERASKRILDKFHYDDEGMEIDGEERVFEDDCDWYDRDCHVAQESVQTVVNHEFVLKENPKYPSQTFAALNAHIVTAINLVTGQWKDEDGVNARLRRKILILCAGNGEDMNRLAHQEFPNLACLHLVGATDLNPRARYVRDHYYKLGADYRSTPSYLHDVDFSEFLAQEYDLIICHHGIHHIMATTNGSLALQRLLRDHLSRNGIFIGDFVDFQSLTTYEQYTHLPANGVELCGEDYADSRGVEGVMRVRVRNDYWLDPILTLRRLTQTLDGCGGNLHYMCGKGAFYSKSNITGDIFEPPETVKDAAARSEVRVITYVEYTKAVPRYCLPLDVVNPYVADEGAIEWKAIPVVPANVAAELSFAIDKALPIQAGNLHYVCKDRYLFAEKTNGYGGRMVIREGSAYLLVGFGKNQKIFFANGFCRTGSPVLKLQVEVLSEWGVPPTPRQVVVLDFIDLGPHTPSGFYSRKCLMEAVYSNTKWMARLFSMKDWLDDYDSASDNIWSASEEGIIMVGYAQPVPRFNVPGKPHRDRLAMYSKMRATVDVISPDGGLIIEQDLTGKFVRHRPDKDIPNTPHQVLAAKEMIPFECLDELIRTRHDIGAERKFLEGWECDFQSSPEYILKIVLTDPGARSIATHPRLSCTGDLDKLPHFIGYVPDPGEVELASRRAKFVKCVMSAPGLRFPADNGPSLEGSTSLGHALQEYMERVNMEADSFSL